MTTQFALALILTVTASLNLVALVRAWARRRLLDIPNARSSHQTPTPRGGGLAIVIVFLCGLLWAWWSGRAPAGLALALFLGGGLVAAIGFADDHRNLPAAPRLAVQVVAALLGLAFLGGVPPLPLGAHAWDLGPLGWALGLVGLVWLTNLTNFMDGIDGLVASHTLFVSLAGVFLCWLCGAPQIAAVLALLAAATSGFLVFNWPPASIFMGDVGSGFLGLVLGLIAIAAAPAVNLWAWGILMAPFIADATVTRAVRIIRYRDWLGAHRAHVYQRLARSWGGHLPVVQAYWLVSLTVILPAALWAALHPGQAWLVMGAVWLACFALAAWLGGGRDDADTPAPAQPATGAQAL